MDDIQQKFERLINTRINTLEYRAWLKDQHRMAKVLADFGFNDASRPYVIEAKNNEDGWEHIEKANTVLMVSTGLKDLNGNPIFTGDILIHDWYGRGIVFWTANPCGEYEIYLFSEDSKYIRHYKTLHESCNFEGFESQLVDLVAFEGDCEILGNIYQNPELLEGVSIKESRRQQITEQCNEDLGQDPIHILKIRLASGKISKEEYLDLKSILEPD